MMKKHSRKYSPNAIINKRLMIIHIIYTYLNLLKLVFVKYIDFMNSRYVIFKIYKTIEHELRAFIIRE